MNSMIAVFCLAAVAMALPVPEEEAPFIHHQTMDVDGSYNVTYSSPESSKTERRFSDGTVVGGYQYVDSDNKVQKVQYQAGITGVQIVASNLPVGTTDPVEDTPEVVKATQEHFHLVQKAQQDHARRAQFDEEYRRAHPELFIVKKTVKDHPEFVVTRKIIVH